jgi:UDP-N-acetylglucosamine:LPS N-acetylglucosamine transferase
LHALIFMSDTGGGHLSLTRAVATALEADGGRATIVDPFQAERSHAAGTLMSAYGALIRAAPRLYGLAFDLTNSAARFEVVYRLLGGRTVARSRAVLAAASPDVAVFAHALAVRPGLDALDGLGLSVPAVAMVTELATVHASWIDARVTRYLAASDEVVRSLRDLGVAPARIARTGLPVGPCFGRVGEPIGELRRRLRLVADMPTALVLAGGEGSGPVEAMVPALARALPHLQLAVVCGRNQTLYRALDGHGLPPTVRILGFIDNVAELMHAADFVLTKGGPQSLSETLAAGRPAIVFDLLPGQERGNGAYVVRRAAGFLALDLPGVLAAARRLTDDPALRCRLASAARALGQPGAAACVAAELRAFAAAPTAAARSRAASGQSRSRQGARV